MTPHRTLAILEALVDVIAIIGLVVLASLRVVEGSTVLPLITLVAGGSIGARVAKRVPRLPRRRGDDDTDTIAPRRASMVPTPPDDETTQRHVSILALAALPFVHFALGHARAALATLVLVLAALLVSSCGAGSTLPDTLWRLTRGACSVVVALPEGAAPAPEPGVKAARIDVDGGAP